MSARLRSVDALRGVAVAAMLLVNNPGDADHVYAPLRHARWDGCTLADLVFPTFLFVVGLSLGLAPPPDLRGALARAARIFGVGLALNVVSWLALAKEHLRLPGVLQRIGLCLALAVLVQRRLGARAQWLLMGAIALTYAALLALDPQAHDPYAALASRLDAALLGAALYRYDPATGLGHDPEGLAATVPALATVLLGLRAANLLRAGHVGRLALIGAALIGTGLALTPVVALNKGLWSPTYAALGGGVALGLLALAHGLCDRRGAPAPCVALGRYALPIYVLAIVVRAGLLASGVHAWLYATLFVRPFGAWLTPEALSLLFALAAVGAYAVLARFAQARGLRLRL